MKWPWISRRIAAAQLAREIARSADVGRQRAHDAQVLALTQERDWLRARNEQLTDVIIAFKRDGYGIPTKGSIKQAPDVETIALERAEGRLTKQFVDNATRAIMNDTGVSAAEAEREARRLREEAVAEHPASG